MPDIMEPTRDGQKNAILTYDSAFLNCDCMFIEYDDVIKCPFFIFLNNLKENEALSTLFDLTEISDLDMDGLYEWYINRRYQNIFKCLKMREGVLETYFDNDENIFNDWCDTVLYQSMDKNSYFVDYDTELNFVNTLKILMNRTLVPKYYVYTPVESNAIKNDLTKIFSKKITYVYGDLENVLRENKITANSTFVFSDLTKIQALANTGLLAYSSVIIADKYAYNYKDEDNPIIDLEAVSKNACFKLDFFNNIDKL